jgi:polyphosphate kinase
MTTKAKASSKTQAASKSAQPKKNGASSVETLFFSRDESWLRFNQRVLEEAQDETNPVMERVKFLAISASNLDEFVEIRVAAFLQRLEDGYDVAQPMDEGGLRPQERLDKVTERMHEFVDAQYRCWNEQLLPALAAQKVRVLAWKQLSDSQRTYAQKFYEEEIDPILTPVTIDPSHPFPRVLNKALCVGLLLRSKRRVAGQMKAATSLGVVTVPRSLPRVICLPADAGYYDVMFLHELIESHVQRMFRGYEVLSQSAFRVTRNSNLYMQEEESRSVLESVRAELHNRRKGDVVRLEIEKSATEEMIERLRTNFELEELQVFRTDGPVNLSRLMHFYSEVKRPELKFAPFVSKDYKVQVKSGDLFEELRNRDVLIHNPFDSYNAVEEFIEAGAKDPHVISMRQTLYRTSNDSPIFKALTEAGQSKEVTVVVELMARFDEESNLRWARELEDAGVGVYHGVFGYKTHCKLALLVRRDPDGVLRRYAHLGTGNYNPVTARFYTDVNLLTSRRDITAAVQQVFNYLTAETETGSYEPLLVAPLTLWDGFVTLIERETAHAKAGKPAAIVAKMNALLDRRIVEALYAASQAGVEIDLIIRGMCSLRPGLKGISDRIRVRSIVGRFLEHSRIFWFQNAGEPEIFCGSADWMARNLVERCEVVFPVQDKELAKRLKDEILEAYLADNVKARILQPSGEYIRAGANGHSHNERKLSAQDYLMGLAMGAADKAPTAKASHEPKHEVKAHEPTVVVMAEIAKGQPAT